MGRQRCGGRREVDSARSTRNCQWKEGVGEHMSVGVHVETKRASSLCSEHSWGSHGQMLACCVAGHGNAVGQADTEGGIPRAEQRSQQTKGKKKNTRAISSAPTCDHSNVHLGRLHDRICPCTLSARLSCVATQPSEGSNREIVLTRHHATPRAEQTA
jgi:hypothetical protein